jgi:hypothetical protein
VPLTGAEAIVGYGNSVWFIGTPSSDLFTTTDFVAFQTVVGPSGYQNIRYLNNIYIAVGSTGLIATSTDLINWTTRSSGTSANFNDVTWTGTNYVVCGDSSAIRYSTDLATWTAATGFSGTGRSLVSGASGTVVVSRPGGATSTMYSTNHGQSWTASATPPTNAANKPTSTAFGNSTFVLVNSSSEIWTSSDGSSWTQQTDGTTDGHIGIAYSGSVWFAGSRLALGNAGVSSTNLTSWTLRTISALSAASGAGGAGGANWGGGGGGGAASLNGNNSGAGGAGAAGRVRVYTW